MLRRLSFAAAAIFALPVAAQIGAGNLAVYRVGTGSGALGSGATATFVDVFSNAGALQSSITIDATGANRLTNSGTATSEGFLNRSTNGLLLNFGGYDADAGTAGIAATTAATNPRVIGQIDATGTYSRPGNMGGTAYSGSNIRSAVSNGSTYWTGGTGSPASGGGVWTTTGTTQVSSTVTNVRVVNIFSDQLYFSTGAGTRGIYAVGTGTPTGAGVTSTIVFATGTTSSPYSFQANTAGSVVYVADDNAAASGGGIQKWTWNGSTWTLAYTLATGATSGARGLTIDWSDPSAPVLYATTTETSANRLIKITDTGAGSSFSTLATAGANTAFRGVDQTLLPATWTASASGNFVNTNTSTTGFGNQYSNWSVGLADGINLAFQRVNAATVTATNNGPLTSVSSITFTGGGFGSQNTQYTLAGNALSLTGVVAGGTGVTNNSSVTQTINLNLTIFAPQTFDAAAGNLTFGGAIDLVGANQLTVTGTGTTTITGQITGAAGGSLSKTGTGTLVLTNNNTYNNGTLVSDGTVLVSGTNATGTGTTVVSGSGRLQGNATLASVFMSSGGTVAPGTSPGTLNSGSATWNGGAIYEFEINDATGSAGVNWDLWNVTNSNGLTINAASGNEFIINIPDPQTVANFDPSQSYSWEFVTFVGTIQGLGFDPNAFQVLYGSPFSGSFAVSQVGSGLFLNFTPTPVPEPGAYMLAASAAGLWLLRRRRAV